MSNRSQIWSMGILSIVAVGIALPALQGGNEPLLFAVTDMEALLRTAPPQLSPTGERLPYGSMVVVEQEQTVNKIAYVKVRERDAKGVSLGWTTKSNLGSPKEFDDAMKAVDRIDVDQLKGLALTMASLYNARGKYLKERATKLQIDASSLAAVLEVESGGRGFSGDGRMIVRFENHVFLDQWGKSHKPEFDMHFKFDPKEKWKGQEWRKGETGAFEPCHKSQTQEWAVLAFAQTLNDGAAKRSASYGIAQIMGFNHAAIGHADINDMFSKFNESITSQLDGFVRFIQSKPNCVTGLKDRDFKMFAECYNGKGQPAEYVKRFQDAATEYKKLSTGLQHGD